MHLKRAFGLAAVAAAFLVYVPKAGAQTTSVTGDVTNKRGDAVGTFTGEFDLIKFVVKKGELYAVGTLNGTIDLDQKKDKKVKNRQVMLPVDLDKSGIPSDEVAAAGDGDIEASALDCSVLHLDLGPLDLSLLGLNVHLNEVVLDITADPTGGLLGEILGALCGLSLTDILGLIGDIGDLADFLNLLLGLLG